MCPGGPLEILRSHALATDESYESMMSGDRDPAINCTIEEGLPRNNDGRFPKPACKVQLAKYYVQLKLQLWMWNGSCRI